MAMLATTSNPPGLWMHIDGTLSAPTSFARYVSISCGAYWIVYSHSIRVSTVWQEADMA